MTFEHANSATIGAMNQSQAKWREYTLTVTEEGADEWQFDITVPQGQTQRSVVTALGRERNPGPFKSASEAQAAAEDDLQQLDDYDGAGLEWRELKRA